MGSQCNSKRRKKLHNNLPCIRLVTLALLINIAKLSAAQENSAIELNYSVPENVTVGFTVARLQPSSSGGFFIIEQDENFATYFDVDLLQSNGEITTVVPLDHETDDFHEVSVIDGTGTYFTV